jgi:bifunctional non-homologous end joining protein LigD
MGLQRYREKRDFAVTPEPTGGKRSATGFSYVIQKHAASHLHYDFRLELDGVLLSWAVPKGPSLDPNVRRLAMQTEDHPIDYGGFEGTIPEGEYGGGTVMIWDRGTWEPLDDARKGYAKGHLRFALHGDKLRGAWHLVRTGKASDEKKGWLLFKSHDAEARTSGSIVEELTDSALSGRTMDQIARARDNVWHSNRGAKNGAAGANGREHGPNERRAKATPPHGKPNAKLVELLEAGVPRRLPSRPKPQQATAVKRMPTGKNWAHELSYDGQRLFARLENGRAELLGPKGIDWPAKVPAIVEALQRLPFSTALFDGEIALQRSDGTTDRADLDQALEAGETDDVTFFVYDVLHLDGRDVSKLPLAARKTILEAALAGRRDPRIHFVQHLIASGDDVYREACRLGARGVVSKRLDRPYRAGKGRDWVLARCDLEQKSGSSERTERTPKRGEKKPRPGRRATPRAASKAEDGGDVVRGAAVAPARALPVRLTHPERVLYPREGITKQELAEYYAAVSDWMMPHVANRPLTLVRCPQGVGKQKFFQKHAKPPLPEAIRAIPIDDDGATVQYMAIDGQAGLLNLVQMSVLEIHTWGAHADDPEKPDFLVFDLDPDEAVKWTDVITCARLLRDGLGRLGLESYVKTTGGKGLHVCLPIARRVSWDDAKEFCRQFTELIVRVKPDAYVATMSKAQRRGKIFIDFFRNGRGATFIAPYSTRARDGAAVAMPLAWDELSPKVLPDHFHVRNAMKRLATLKDDPWKDASTKKQQLTAAAVRAVSRGSA